MIPDRERKFRTLYEQTYLDVTKFVERRVDEDAEDIVSSTFLTAWRRLDDAPEDARPWLFVIAKNTMGNHYRSVFRRTNLDVKLIREPPREMSDPASRDRWIDLTRAWGSLRARDREALALSVFDGLGPDEAAKVLGIRRSTFSMRLARARSRLDASLGARAADDDANYTPREQKAIAP